MTNPFDSIPSIPRLWRSTCAVPTVPRVEHMFQSPAACISCMGKKTVPFGLSLILRCREKEQMCFQQGQKIKKSESFFDFLKI